MNIKQLEYFISVAENLNFTNAAKEHYLSQTAISQQIKNLENILGFKLFVRNKKFVKLTPSGDMFYSETKSLLEKLNNSIANASNISSGYIGTINIGFFERYDNTLLPKLLSTFKSSYPQINFNIISGNIDELYKKLQNNLLDFVFGYDFTTGNYSFIESKLLSTCELCVVLYKKHKFASRDILTRTELQDEDFIFINRSTSPFAFDMIISNFISFGFSPNIKYTVDSLETILLLIKANCGITILPKYKDIYKSDDLIFIPLKDEHANFIVSWNKNSDDSKIKIFLEFINNII